MVLSNLQMLRLPDSTYLSLSPKAKVAIIKAGDSFIIPKSGRYTHITNIIAEDANEYLYSWRIDHKLFIDGILLINATEDGTLTFLGSSQRDVHVERGDVLASVDARHMPRVALEISEASSRPRYTQPVHFVPKSTFVFLRAIVEECVENEKALVEAIEVFSGIQAAERVKDAMMRSAYMRTTRSRATRIADILMKSFSDVETAILDSEYDKFVKSKEADLAKNPIEYDFVNDNVETHSETMKLLADEFGITDDLATIKIANLLNE